MAVVVEGTTFELFKSRNSCPVREASDLMPSASGPNGTSVILPEFESVVAVPFVIGSWVSEGAENNQFV